MCGCIFIFVIGFSLLNFPEKKSDIKHTFNKMETKEELRKRLTPLQYQVTQEAGTERAFTGIF